MNRLALIMILGLVATYLVSALLPRLSQVPHHHVLVGNVSAAELEAHLEAERAEPNIPAHETRLYAGIILSIPFGDLFNFYVNLGMCLLVMFAWMGVVAFQMRMLLHSPLIASTPLPLAVPPPRFV